MRRVKNKSKRILAELLRSQGGFSVLVIIFVMLVLTVIGYSMTRMMATKQKSVPVTAHSSNAFAMAESGINWAGKVLSDSEATCWPPPEIGPQIEKDLGGGKFVLDFSECDTQDHPDCGDSAKQCIMVASTGTFGDGKRVLKSIFCREIGYGCANIVLESCL
jgi:hypothetical protein